MPASCLSQAFCHYTQPWRLSTIAAASSPQVSPSLKQLYHWLCYAFPFFPMFLHICQAFLCLRSLVSSSSPWGPGISAAGRPCQRPRASFQHPAMFVWKLRPVMHQVRSEPGAFQRPVRSCPGHTPRYVGRLQTLGSAIPGPRPMPSAESCYDRIPNLHATL